ncbi:hypothetical protein [Lacibacter sediminis]|uniref:DoxX family protein n=1 Tax=Lacibacter sediminis TaxID=2760713 RepID=A0A7G5XDZ6_9BACT|nr:hypothetical protein [Lacibacter sediminis]QNA43699.1 hypothetical protein H4075_16670 [Lacibacter sediminis]
MGNLSAEPLPWNSYRKTGFRFAFIFFILFIVLLDWSVNPVFSYVYYEAGLAEFLDAIINQTGKNLFHISYTIISPYDGQHNDRTYAYLLYFIMLMAALFGTIIWTALDRKRTNYDTLYYWLTTIIRYYLAFTLFLFALEKFFKLQFPDLGLYLLSEPVGNLSPMNLAWAFFGYSYGYNIFMGIAESAALLLLFRRTMTFGSILTLFTLANVMAVNYNYNVHAKMYPTALFVMTLFLLIPQLNSLFRFFFTGEATALAVIKAPVFKKRWMTISKAALKLLLIGYFLLFSVKDYIGYQQRKVAREINKSQSGLSGVYAVETFVMNKDSLSTENPLRWNQFILGGARERIRLKADSIAYIDVSVDKKEMFVYGDRNELAKKDQEICNELGFRETMNVDMDSIFVARQIKSRFQFGFIDSTTLWLKGKIKNDSVFMTAKKQTIKPEDFRLMKNGFQWITE